MASRHFDNKGGDDDDGGDDDGGDNDDNNDDEVKYVIGPWCNSNG